MPPIHVPAVVSTWFCALKKPWYSGLSNGRGHDAVFLAFATNRNMDRNLHDTHLIQRRFTMASYRRIQTLETNFDRLYPRYLVKDLSGRRGRGLFPASREK